MTSLPEGLGLVLDPSVRVLDGGRVLIGGSPGRLLTLTDEGVLAVEELLGAAQPATESARRLGRRLVDAGMAHPAPRAPAAPTTVAHRVTVVVPAFDRPDRLATCLGSLRRTEEGTALAVVVVDDGSEDPAAIEEVCRRFGARLVVRATNGGPGAARNDGVGLVDTELVAFLDSDCTIGAGWLAPLLPFFDDPAVGAVAPRIRPTRESGRSSVLARFAEGHSDLDMGDRESAVGPERRVRYVPAAALVVRRGTLSALFDPSLRIGEDVDFVWRLADADWSLRYVPEVEVAHAEPGSWRAWLERRFRYGTSAAPLSLRHPGRLAPLELRPGPTLAALAFLVGRPRTALAVVGVSAALLARRVRGRHVPASLPVRWSAEAAGWTVIGIGHAATVLAAPVLAALGRRSRRSAAMVLALALGPPLVEWWRRRPELDPLRWALASLADDAAYGAGVWLGCVRSGTVRPLLPALAHPASGGDSPQE